MATAPVILWLRRIASCFFFTIAILSAALWVRSLHYQDALLRSASRVFDPAEQLNFIFEDRVVRIEKITSPAPVDGVVRWSWLSNSLRPLQLQPAQRQSRESLAVLGFRWNGITSATASGVEDQLPIWFLMLALISLAIAIRPAPRFKFSLRDLMTLTTVAALTIGPLAFWLRSIG